MSMYQTFVLKSGMVLLFTAANVIASDWPTYRHDIARTGCTSESLKTPLAIQWEYVSAHEPKTAWSSVATRPREGVTMRDRVDFDDAFQVVASGGRLYFGSSIDDRVYALSSDTGAELWSFCTGGPIRLAPMVSDGRVFVGSDDGIAYCLNAETGQLLWKVRGGPADEELLGNGRMISRWPIRTGVLVDDQTAYFGAGIFPHEDVYLIAVRAEDGAIVWRNGTISEGEAYRNDLSPQGYLLATATRLFVPSGQSLPVGFDRSTGSLVFDRDYAWRNEEAGGIVGGTYALLADNQIYTGTQEHMLALDQESGKAGFAWFPGHRLTVSGNMAYMATGREVRAMDRGAYAEASRRRNSLEFKAKTLRTRLASASGDERKTIEQNVQRATAQLAQYNREKVEPTVKWQVASPCDAELVVCENLVLAGGQNEVRAFSRDNGELVWKTQVEGRTRGLVIADGHLYVSTDKGRIYGFAPARADDGNVRAVKQSRTLAANPYPQDELTPVYRAAAEAIVMESGVTKGYCLLLGAEGGRLAFELTRRTDLHIIGVEPNLAKVRAARAALDAAGLYGDRVVIDHGELSALPYSDYFANLIVSDTLLLTGEIPGEPGALARHVKPCGGVVCLGMPADRLSKAGGLSRDKLAGWLDKMQLGRNHTSETNGLWASLRRGPLPGAGRWTHQYANAGNTACSDDRVLAGSLGLLWFGEPGSAPMVNRHDAAAAPLAVNGRMFIQGENVVMVYDSYNGVQLWKRDIPGAMRTRLKQIECGNLAASEDSFFVALPDKCLRLDAETGKTLATYPLPSAGQGPARWGFLAYSDGVIYGSAMANQAVSNVLFAFDVGSGELLWQYKGGNIVNLTVALGDGWLFFVDSSITPGQREQLLREDKSHLANLTDGDAKQAEEAMKKLDVRMAVALDAKTGGKLWETPVDVTDCSRTAIAGGELTAMYNNGVVVLCGANANGHFWKQFLSGQFSERRLVALSGRTGERLWAKDANYRHRPVLVGDTIYAEPWAYDLKTGQQRTRPNPVTGVETPWQFLRPGHHCGAISACPQMLLMRSGFTAYYDLHEDSGIRHFAGQRPGCWINAIAADGLALIPEASAGCLCLFPITCSLALEPRKDHYRWGIYSAGGAGTPVQHLAVNLGAPGDMRDSKGTLWLAYPRPGLPADRSAMGFGLDVKVEFLPGGKYVSHSDPAERMIEPDQLHMASSFAQGIRQCVIPLRGEADGSAKYTIRLYFPPGGGPAADKMSLDIKLQGNVVAKAVDPIRSAEGTTLEFTGVRVDRNLEIEFVGSGGPVPVLSGIEVLCAQTQTRQVAGR